MSHRGFTNNKGKHPRIKRFKRVVKDVLETTMYITIAALFDGGVVFLVYLLVKYGPKYEIK